MRLGPKLIEMWIFEAMPLKIHIPNFRHTCKIALNRLELNGIESFCFDTNILNLYRFLPSEEIYDATDYREMQPALVDKIKYLMTKIQFGSVVDDWNELQKLLSDEKQPTIYHLKQLGSIFNLASYVLYRQT